jgi:hypothetical protein
MVPNQIRTRTAYLVTLSTMILFACAGCRGPEAPPAPTAEVKPAADVGPDEPSIAMPADFDASLPIFPNATVAHVRRPKGLMREILLDSPAPVDRLIDFYKEALEKNGYEVTSTMKSAARKTWSCDFHKGGEQDSVMLFPSDQDQSHITIDLIYEIPEKGGDQLAMPQEKFDVVGPGEVAQQTPDSNEKRN